MATGGQEWRGGGKKARGEEEREKAPTLGMVQTKTACGGDMDEDMFPVRKIL